MSTSFWHTLSRPFSVLAPMADVTDKPFRQIIATTGRPDVFYNEFLSTDGLCSSVGYQRLAKHLEIVSTDHPIVGQFFGKNPENFYKVAQMALGIGYDGIDINMGCPDRKVMKQGGGAALIKDPLLAQEIIKATQEGAGNLPISVKTRLGFDTVVIDTWIPKLLETKIPVLTIHGRTAKEMSKVPAHWDFIGRVVQMAQGTGTLIVGNGDVESVVQGIELCRQWGTDGYMIGRGIFQNPWLFDESINPAAILPEQRLELLREHVRLFTEYWGPQKNFDTLKRFFKIYVTGWDGAKELRDKLMLTKNSEQVEELI